MATINTVNERLKLAAKGMSVLAVKQREEIIATLGGMEALTPIDLIKVDQVVRLLQRSRRGQSSEDMVRLNNVVARLIDGLQRKVKQRKPQPSHTERLAVMGASR